MGGVPLQANNKEMKCFYCDIDLKFDAAEKNYRCPTCGSSWNPTPPDYGIEDLWESEQAYKKSISKQGGQGSKKKGKNRSRQHPGLITERYKLE